MHGCLKVIMVVLALLLAIALSVQIYIEVKKGNAITGEEAFELAIYSCSVIICIMIIVELFKWGRR